MTGRQSRQRLTMPGQGPTDEDLRHDVDLTRDELATTIDALAAKADIKAHLRHATRRLAPAVAGLAVLMALIALWWKRTR